MDYRDAVIAAEKVELLNTVQMADAIFAAYQAGRQIDSDAIAEYLASRGEVTVSAESWRKFQAWQQSSSVDLNEELDGLLADKRRMNYIRKTSHDATDGMYTPLPGAPVRGSIEKRLDAAIEHEAGQ